MDITGNQMVEEIFSKYQPRAIVHFAAESHVDRSINSADQFIKTNINGTYNLLVNALKYFDSTSKEITDRFNFIHVSTDEVFGSLEPEDDGFTETSPYKPNSPYSASKALGTWRDAILRLLDYQQLSQIAQITTDLISILKNLSQRCWFFTGKKIPVYGDGVIRDWLYVGDHCDALLSVLDKNFGESCNVGGNYGSNLGHSTDI